LQEVLQQFLSKPRNTLRNTVDGLKVFRMIDVTALKVDGKNCLGLRVDLPESSAPLLLITAQKGFVMCGFLNIEAAERIGVSAATVSGVRTFDDVLSAPVKATTSKAKSLGVQEGMKGADALKHMF
jgi:uncharacterized protein YunC (DUF1805 family)